MAKKTALVFPGQGSQVAGMGADLYREFQVVRNVFDESRDVLGFDIARLCFWGPQEKLDKTVITQVAVLTMNFAAYSAFEQQTGIRPAVMAGHSLGEYSALHIAGSISFGDALKLVSARGGYQQEAVPAGVGSMAALVGLERNAVEEICLEVRNGGGMVYPAIFNTDDQIVISGCSQAVERAVEAARKKGARGVKLPISVPCHCRLMEPAADRFAADLNAIEFRDCEIPVIPNCDPGLFYSRNNVRGLLLEQIKSPVRWRETVEKMVATGIDTIIEIGPKRVLSAFIKRIAPQLRIFNVENLETLRKTDSFFSGQRAGMPAVQNLREDKHGT
ncbi:MAG: ACP S-malonyltransferase [Syntrophales bacterium]